MQHATAVVALCFGQVPGLIVVAVDKDQLLGL